MMMIHFSIVLGITMIVPYEKLKSLAASIAYSRWPSTVLSHMIFWMDLAIHSGFKFSRIRWVYHTAY
jgi:hypothetical protein